MQKHIKNYLQEFNITPDDVFICENCGRNGMVHFHHIKFRSDGGGDEATNIMCLCQDCHFRAHSREISEEYLRNKHLSLKYS